MNLLHQEAPALSRERFALADAVRDGDMTEGMFRDWLIESTDEDVVYVSHTTPYRDWLEEGPAFVASHPIESVSFSDRRPYLFSDDKFAWCNWTSGAPVYPDPDDYSELPAVQMRYLHPLAQSWYVDAEPFYRDNKTYVSYDTRQDAIADLSRACIAWAHDVALQQMGVHLVC